MTKLTGGPFQWAKVTLHTTGGLSQSPAFETSIVLGQDLDDVRSDMVEPNLDDRKDYLRRVCVVGKAAYTVADDCAVLPRD